MPNVISLCLCLLLLAACQPKQADNSVRVLQQQAELLLSLSPASAPVETPLRLSLVSEQPIELISAELTGVSMYMGIIPLPFQKVSTVGKDDAEQWQAEFLLGACADPAMLWQLNLTVQFADGRKLILKEQFNSSW
ncbi:hypothetical protein [Arsukibacterium sp.]|uniref:hypothetical protein n=1 Tax=Arsukibacterium sp. TaxID=1977258 RepID=UPI00299ED9CB|nr:hypothetical protein [Arsukibacterium sp.]MDX1537989.1 hypothetical protein [Arsukibacterium sp.]